MPRIDVNLDGGLNTQDDEYKVRFNGFTTLQNIRQVDGVIAKRYGTGSQNHTMLSYDKSGSYFDFDMSMLESG